MLEEKIFSRRGGGVVTPKMLGMARRGIEPVTFALLARRSNQLS